MEHDSEKSSVINVTFKAQNVTFGTHSIAQHSI